MKIGLPSATALCRCIQIFHGIFEEIIEMDEMLINAVQLNSIIYDYRDVHHKDRDLMRKAWENVNLGTKLSDNELNKPHKDKYVLHKNCEAQIHKQIDEEMHASLVYATMAAHFDHNSVARKGLAKFFSENSEEERQHAHKFIDYLNSRGARFSGFDVKMPTKATWTKAVEALGDALNLEKHVNNKLHHLHDVAALQCLDQHLMDFLEGEFLDEQVKSIDQLQRYISILNGMDTPMGEFLLDQQLQGSKSEL